MLLTAALLASTLAAPAPACPTSPADFGPAAAPIEIVAFLDPFAGSILGLWLELRRFIADQRGLASLRIVLAPATMVDTPGDARLLRWLIGSAARGKQERALRILDRDGRDRLGVRLTDPASRSALAEELGLDPAIQAQLLDESCADATLKSGKLALRRLHTAAGGYLGRSPIFVIGHGLAFEDSSTLERLRLELAHERQRLRSGRVAARKSAPSRKGLSPRLMRPPASAGMILGGVGLPHRLVIFADHDEHPNFSLLGPVLELRRQQPGRLAVQVIARGNTSAARQLRLRTCVAQRLGLEIEYLRLLARDRREPPSGPGAEFFARLDAAPEAQTCELTEPELERGPGGVAGLPDGVWLDGALVGQSDLENLPARLIAIEAAQRPLDAVFSAAAPEP